LGKRSVKYEAGVVVGDMEPEVVRTSSCLIAKSAAIALELQEVAGADAKRWYLTLVSKWLGNRRQV
jgi:hypothetical protein